MTGIVIADWIKDFNNKMKREGREILLLDNAPSHIPPVDKIGKSILTNVKIHFFQATRTSFFVTNGCQHDSSLQAVL